MDLDPLVDLLRGKRVAVLTGAGCSTESGIPDYRGPETARRARRPVQFREFVGSAAWRQRYWARSTVGYARVQHAEPNAAHHALAAWEQDGQLTGLITQNVDSLHRRAGSTRLVALHGRLADVVCLDCGWHGSRDAWQVRLRDANPDWSAEVQDVAPDGDVELPLDAYAAFRVPDCPHCGGVVKPHVVFFGENVPRDRVDRARGMLAEAEALLVVGSSLTVFSGYRFVKYAVKDGKPVGIIDLGPTRGDGDASCKLVGKAGEVLPVLRAVLKEAR